MIVALEELKRVLGIDLDETSEDENLTRLIVSATAWVEGETHRRFDVPVRTEEFHEGRGRRKLYLNGHVDDSPEADNASETLDPTTSVVVSCRPMWATDTTWETLSEGVDFERRGDSLVFLGMWRCWDRGTEYKISLLDGYAVAPEDIRALVLELAMNQYLIDATAASGTAGVTSEKLGDFSYTVDLGAVATGSGGVTENGTRTLKRWTRVLV